MNSKNVINISKLKNFLNVPFVMVTGISSWSAFILTTLFPKITHSPGCSLLLESEKEKDTTIANIIPKLKIFFISIDFS